MKMGVRLFFLREDERAVQDKYVQTGQTKKPENKTGSKGGLKQEERKNAKEKKREREKRKEN